MEIWTQWKYIFLFYSEKQKNLAAELVFACPKASVVELNWRVAYGILAMMTTLCNPTTNSLKRTLLCIPEFLKFFNFCSVLLALYDTREQKCEVYIKRVTTNCARESGIISRGYAMYYPSNLRIMVLGMKDQYGRWRYI